MAYEAITDPTNPFNIAGLSAEVYALLAYVEDASKAMNVDVVVTCTTDHPVYAASGNKSRHRQEGTAGEGLAIDLRMRQRGDMTHAAAFTMFRPVALDCHELIYAGADKNIRAGRWVEPYATSTHRDHVHVSVDRGVFLRWHSATPSPLPPLTNQEDDMFTDEDRRLLQGIYGFAINTEQVLPVILEKLTSLQDVLAEFDAGNTTAEDALAAIRQLVSA